MATKQELLTILRAGLSGQVSEADLETLAETLSGRPGVAARSAATEEELKARKEVLESIGESNRARREEQSFIEQELQLKQQELLALEQVAAANAAAAQQARENAQATQENAEATLEQSAQMADSAKNADKLREEINQLRRRQAALRIETQQTGEAFGFLGGVLSNTTKEFAEIGKTGTTTAGVFQSLKGVTKDLSGAMTKLATSDVVQGFASQGDILNQLVSETTRAFEIASKLDTVNTQLYKTMGIAGKETKKFSFEIAELAGGTLSLSRVGPELSEAAMALQQAQKGFDFEQDKGMVSQIALLKQAGMSADIAAEVYTLYSKAGGDMAKQAGDINLKLLAIARELGQAPDQVASAFKSGMSAVAAYGSRAETVFGRMLAVANKLGTSINDMLNSMERLDEIDAAQKVAGELNAILQLTGKNALQGFMLAAAEAPEKLMMIQKALATPEARAMLEGPGGRFRIKEIANTVPLSAEMIRKMMATPAEELMKSANKMANVQAISLKQLQEENYRNLSASEKASKRNEDRLAAIIDPATAQGVREGAAGFMSSNAGRGLMAAIGTGLGVGLPLLLRRAGAGGAAGAVGGMAGGAAAGAGGLAAEAALTQAESARAGGRTQPVSLVGCVRICPDSISALANQISIRSGAGGLPIPAGGGTPDAGDAAGLLSSGLGKAGAIGAAGLGLGMFGKDVYDIATSKGEAKAEDTFGAGGSLIGGVIGGALGAFAGPFGIALGAGLGSSAGNFVGGMMGSSRDAAKARTKMQQSQLRNLDTGQLDDFKINSSDEIIGVKEGGLIAKKLDRLISIMSGQGGTTQDVVLQIDGAQVGKAAIKSINNNFYNMRD